MSTERGVAIGSPLTTAVLSATILYLFLSFLLFLTGEITLQSFATTPGIHQIFLRLDRPLFFPIIGTILFWDILLYVLAWAGLSRTTRRGEKGEILLAGVLVFALWRVVGNSIASLLFLPGREAPLSAIPGFFETLVFIVVLALGKLTIARNLEKAARRFDAPLLEVFTWHHRKDAIFNTLFVLTALTAGLGWDDGRVAYYCHFLKILLLGSASWAISRDCIKRLAPEAGELGKTSEAPVSCSCGCGEPEAAPLPEIETFLRTTTADGELRA